MKVTPFETYQTYLSMKSHFTNKRYDFFKYGGKSRATMTSFNKRKDKYWFEKTSRKYSDQEITDFLFKEQSKKLLSEKKLEEVFNCSKGHPPILKKYLGGEISLETLVIFEKIFSFGKKFNRKLKDPVWETVSMKMKKYVPFLNINVFHYKKILREIVNE